MLILNHYKIWQWVGLAPNSWTLDEKYLEGSWMKLSNVFSSLFSSPASSNLHLGNQSEHTYALMGRGREEIISPWLSSELANPSAEEEDTCGRSWTRKCVGGGPLLSRGLGVRWAFIANHTKACRLQILLRALHTSLPQIKPYEGRMEVRQKLETRNTRIRLAQGRRDKLSPV